MHEVSLAFQHYLVHPGDAKTIPEVRQAGLYSRRTQLCLYCNPRPAINGDKEVNLTAGAVAEVVEFDGESFAVMKEVAKLEQVQGDQVLESRCRGLD